MNDKLKIKSFTLLFVFAIVLSSISNCTPESNTTTENSSSNNNSSPSSQNSTSATNDDSTENSTSNSAQTSDSSSSTETSTTEDSTAPDEESTDPDPEPAIVCNSFSSFPTGVSIEANLLNTPKLYEPSGAAWNATTQKLFLVSDEGIVSQMDADGTQVENWILSGDFEGIAIADPDSDFVYIGRENPDAILELNLATSTITRTFDLTPWMASSAANLGLEALTFVADTSNSEGGYFYAGLQETGEVFVFSLPIASSTSSTTVTPVTSFELTQLNAPTLARTSISDLYYNASDGHLYALYRGLMSQITTDGVVTEEWTTPGDGTQEGLAMDPESCSVFIAQDSGAVLSFDFAP